MSPEKPNKSLRDNSHPASRDADGQRIAKLLARAGVASRREIERMIAEGRVAIDGQAIDTPATILRSLKGVTVDGNPVEAAAPARLFLYHKPSGVLVTERDPNGRPTIYDRLPKDLPRLVPVGRLDLNTEGLLLLTTDGELKRQLELPATGVERAYRARAYGTVTQAQLEDLIEGVEIEGVRYGSIDANLERRTGANVWIEMILTEGKNREVRRVLEYLGLKVSRLIRTRYGPFILADLPVGGIGEVRQHDIVAFRKDPRRMPPAEPAKFRESRGRDAAASRPESPALRRGAAPAKPGASPARGRPAAGRPIRDQPGRGEPSPGQSAQGQSPKGLRPQGERPNRQPARGQASRDPQSRHQSPAEDRSDGRPQTARQRRTASDPRRARTDGDTPSPQRTKAGVDAPHHPRPGKRPLARTAGKARSADAPTGTKRPRPPRPTKPRAPDRRR